MASKWVTRLPPYTIYKIVDLTNKQTIYIGLTKRTLHARLQGHSDHTDSPINKLIKEKGKENFSIIAIDYADTQKDGWHKEEFWTKFLLHRGTPLRNKLLGRKFDKETIEKVRKARTGKHMSLAQKEKLSKANKGRFMGIEHLRAKCVKCMETGYVYGSISEASRMTGISISCIAYTCKGKIKQAKGYHWRYATRKEYFLCQQNLG